MYGPQIETHRLIMKNIIKTKNEKEFLNKKKEKKKKLLDVSLHKRPLSLHLRGDVHGSPTPPLLL
jgi:hypothetical protein